ncbi:MAG TPA: hypothetical protein VM802_31355 [Chitinophaga sp.]|uniref:hypothetical protein n=1 Tax=Chitinophaga sp. TaxID=1869181 RepID=UPI002D043499|nr:hypothetical protein [Chitinophaga sp.]HVI49405.1 hypothetical protein [Chitinophaga sp.]
MIETTHLKISEYHLRNLPIFYNYVYYNSIVNLDEYYIPEFSEKICNYVTHMQPDKLISRIIDFSDINEDV